MLVSQDHDRNYPSEIISPENWESIYHAEMSPKFWEEFCRETKHDKRVPLRFVGKGEKGVVYDLTTGDVVKITEDEREVKTAAYLLSLGENYDTEVLYIVKDLIPALLKEQKRWIIVQEKLDPLPGGESGDWGRLANLWNLYTTRVKEYEDLKLQEEGSKWKGRREYRRRDRDIYEATTSEHRAAPVQYLIVNSENVDTFVKWVKDTGQEITPEGEEWLYKLGKALETLKIGFADLHSGNIMWRSGGKYPVLIDIGLSRSPQSPIPHRSAVIGKYDK